MAGKAGRSERPTTITKPRAYQVRLPAEEADAFDDLVRQKGEATGAPGALSASAVLRGLVRAALGLGEGEAPKGRAKR